MVILETKWELSFQEVGDTGDRGQGLTLDIIHEETEPFADSGNIQAQC